ncbi:hypothetical protein SAMN05660923_01347 [Tepidimicrobium xylanilyticum]|uniref:Uncharacterized protein n=1 Tax=Tepidimicrobium xylanilyticum TaxID=1123352 RepID=A0A1H2WUC4_9FIRM|nr:hypothetical protein SAMN05660923_01347 [Tepidimicrobium xylanilyticum]
MRDIGEASFLINIRAPAKETKKKIRGILPNAPLHWKYDFKGTG